MKILKHCTQIIFVCLFASILFVSCKEDDEKFPTFPTPVWNVNSAEYSVNMTAVVTLPQALIQYAEEGDQLAAFSGDVCRGVGEIIDGLYYVAILGMPEDQSNIHFRYYSIRNEYLYQTADLFAFDADEIFGTTDEPETIELSIVK